ncbi:MAG: ABC transporter ATP-binding protein [Coxiellaceae bacterium]|nr:ABC transporter ATP-binding protein [Coxiellaceae bacterium]
MTSLLQVKDLSVAFNIDGQLQTVVNKLNYTLDAGQCVALVGESGSGKTLSALALLQLLPPTAVVSQHAKVFFENKDILTLSEQKMRFVRGGKIAMIFQDALAALNPVFTIGQQIDEVIRLHQKQPAQQRRQKALDLLLKVGIDDAKRCYQSYPHQLSGGMRQRAMIAMALACEPAILIADEPCTALDVTIQAQVMALLKKLKDEHQLSILFISHDLAVVKQIADEVIVMQQGACVEHAKTKAFYQSPQHQYTRQLLQAIPSMQAKQKANASDEDLLSVKQLKTYFPIKKGLLRRTTGFVKAVDDVSFDLKAGQTLAVVGESGSGKTTMAKTVVDLIKPTDGVIQCDVEASEIQMIFQDPYGSLNPRMMILDSLMEGLRIRGKAGNYKQQQQLADQLLQQVGLLPEHKARYPHQFSGGQRQRICIARALALQPKLLILDEPTSALDVSVQMQILQLLQDLQQRLGVSYLLITHNLGVVAYLAHWIAVMYHGRIVESGPTAEVLSNPQQAYTQRLLAAVPTL